MLSKEGELEAAQRSLQGRKPTKKSSKEQNLSLTLTVDILPIYRFFTSATVSCPQDNSTWRTGVWNNACRLQSVIPSISKLRWRRQYGKR
ncbi:hypothetical protein SAY87_026932 [Trapa incisa]|uniref:Uncharacterized protein n=1 Tax=Trapa incisa TaxID=236973 RepID=A0AAN7JMF3_9MYRT|nr:hypothetical protein SAY87_026932 [Trapa incisa]